MNLLSVLLKLFTGSTNPTSKNRSTYQGDFEPRMEAGEKTIDIQLDSMDHRRLRSQFENNFRCRFWYASAKDEIYVYPLNDFGDSKLPVGIVPQRYNLLLLPFINNEYEVNKYRATFIKAEEVLNVYLIISTVAMEAAKNAEDQKNCEQDKKQKEEDHTKKMGKSFFIKGDLEQTIYITDKKPFKGKEELGELTLKFHEREKYLDPKFQEVMILENGKFLCIGHLSIRLLRTYFSGYDLVVKSGRIIKEKSGQFVNIRLILVIGLPTPV